MAFTEAQKVKIRHYLGWGDVYQQYNPQLEGIFLTIGGRPDTQAAVEGVLADLLAAETKLKQQALSTAGLKRVEEVEWYQSGGSDGVVAVLKDECRRLVVSLAIYFGGPEMIRSDVFATKRFMVGSMVG